MRVALLPQKARCRVCEGTLAVILGWAHVAMESGRATSGASVVSQSISVFVGLGVSMFGVTLAMSGLNGYRARSMAELERRALERKAAKDQVRWMSPPPFELPAVNPREVRRAVGACRLVTVRNTFLGGTVIIGAMALVEHGLRNTIVSGTYGYCAGAMLIAALVAELVKETLQK